MRVRKEEQEMPRLRYELSRPQLRFLRSGADYCAYVSGRASGKTFVGCLWALTQMTRSPMTSGLVGASNPKQLNTAVLPVLFGLLDQAGIAYVHGAKPPWPHREQASYVGTLSIRNGSSAYCRSLHVTGVDSNVRGLNLAWAYIDEARDIEKGAMEVAVAALRGNGDASYQTRITSTPAGFDWIWEAFVDDPLPRSEIVRGSTMDNAPNLPKGFEERLRGTYGKEMAAQEIDGEFVSSRTNRPFRFDREAHVAKTERRKGLPLFLTADQNVDHYSALVMQVDRRAGTAWVLDEIRLETDGTTRECAEEFARRYPDCEHVEFWCDPTSVKRDTRGGASDMEIMLTSLRNALPKAKVREGSDRHLRPVVDEINAVNALLDPALGEPKLKVDPKCASLIRDLEKCRWEEVAGKEEARTDTYVLPVRDHDLHADRGRTHREPEAGTEGMVAPRGGSRREHGKRWNFLIDRDALRQSEYNVHG